jgi:hypothetical protein
LHGYAVRRGQLALAIRRAAAQKSGYRQANAQ